MVPPHSTLTLYISLVFDHIQKFKRENLFRIYRYALVFENIKNLLKPLKYKPTKSIGGGGAKLIGNIRYLLSKH